MDLTNRLARVDAHAHDVTALLDPALPIDDLGAWEEAWRVLGTRIGIDPNARKTTQELLIDVRKQHNRSKLLYRLLPFLNRPSATEPRPSKSEREQVRRRLRSQIARFVQPTERELKGMNPEQQTLLAAAVQHLADRRQKADPSFATHDPSQQLRALIDPADRGRRVPASSVVPAFQPRPIDDVRDGLEASPARLESFRRLGKTADELSELGRVVADGGDLRDVINAHNAVVTAAPHLDVTSTWGELTMRAQAFAAEEGRLGRRHEPLAMTAHRVQQTPGDRDARAAYLLQTFGAVAGAPPEALVSPPPLVHVDEAAAALAVTGVQYRLGDNPSTAYQDGVTRIVNAFLPEKAFAGTSIQHPAPMFATGSTPSRGPNWWSRNRGRVGALVAASAILATTVGLLKGNNDDKDGAQREPQAPPPSTAPKTVAPTSAPTTKPGPTGPTSVAPVQPTAPRSASPTAKPSPPPSGVDPGKPDTSTDVGPETPATPKAKGNAAIAPAKAAAIRDAQERSLQTIGEALRPNDPDVTTNEAIDAIVVRISREHGGNVDKKDLAAQIRAALNAPTPENVSAVIGHDRDSGSVSAKRNRPVTTALVSSLGTQTIAAAAAELPQATEQHRKDVARIAEVGDWATDQGERAGIVSTHISNEVEKNAVLVAQYSNEKDGWTTERADAMFEDGIKAMNENTRTLGKTLPGLLG